MGNDRRSAVLLRAAYSFAVVLVFLYFLMWKVNFYLAESIKQGVYLFFAPVLIAGTLYFRGLRDGIEIRLVGIFLTWVVITRVINGDRVLSGEYLFVLDLALMLPVMELGLVLDAAGRRRVLNWLSVILGVYFFALGVLCILAFLLHTEYINPITGAYLARIINPLTAPMAAVLDTNPNIVAYWFMMPMLLMVYQYFAAARGLRRISAVIVFLASFAGVSLTRCRSVKLALSFSLAVLAVLLVLKLRKGKGKALTAMLLVFAFLLTLPGVYFGFDACHIGLEHASAFLDESKEARASAAERESPAPLAYIAPLASFHPLSAEKTEEAERQDDAITQLNRLSSGRIAIYRAAFQSIRENPRVLLFGSSGGSLMSRTNELLQDTKAHVHNFLLQSLMLAGIPGLLIVLTLLFFLFAAAFRLCFGGRAPLSSAVLSLPLFATFVYGQFEAGFFNFTDARMLFFYLMCGLMLGEYKKYYPRGVAEDRHSAADSAAE